MGKALQQIFPLFLFEQRIGRLGVNFSPPPTEDESGIILSYFAGGSNPILLRRQSRREKVSPTPSLTPNPKLETKTEAFYFRASWTPASAGVTAP
jgi:hypothetical protein